MSDDEILARYYDADQGPFSDDLPFYQALAQRTGGPVLELMCGTGRVLAPLLADGHHVIGIDHAPALLARARARLGRSRRVQLIEADVCDAPIESGCCELAIVALGSLMHLTTSTGQLAALATAWRALRPAGLLAIDLPAPIDLAAHDGALLLANSFRLDDEATLVHKLVAQRGDPATQRDQVTVIYDETGVDGRTTRRTIQFELRWLGRYELEHLLARAGFAVEALYGSYELDPFDSCAERMVCVARRAGL